MPDLRFLMFDEHVEFVNPGGLFGSLKLEVLQTDFYRASHRNKLLAEAFYLSGEVEKYGTGFVRIRERLKGEAPGLEWSFREDSGAFWVTLAGSAAVQDKASEKASEKMSEKILQFLRDDPGLTIAILAEQCGVSTRSIERNLQKLQKDGVVERVGPDKGGHWEIRR